MTPAPATRLFVVIPTHTTRHLDRCLASFARQHRAPDGVVLTCDNDDRSIVDLAASVWQRVAGVSPIPLLAVQRPFTGRPRLNQVRNNGLRALERFAPDDRDLVVLLDGDTMLDETALSAHARRLAEGADLIIPYRVNLDQDQTSAVDLDRVLDPAAPPLRDLIRPAQIDAVRARQRRYERQLRLKRSPLGPLIVKGHKPKILGGHHAVRIGPLRAISGYDEAYVDYGYDDDDLARRLHTLRPRITTAIAVTDCLAYHLWHPSRAPKSPTAAPGYERFASSAPARAELGWSSPAPQEEPVITDLSSSP